jgi:6-pyruvoyltetrahydropterin/6-carboxytetrahydropterin synthase
MTTLGPSATTGTLPPAASSTHQGAITISKGWPVSFSHRVPAPSGDRWCGHNCDVRVQLHGPPDPVGMVWDYGALGPAKAVFEQVDHRHLDDLLPGLPAPCQDTTQLLADFLHARLVARAGLPFAHLLGDVQVVDAWPDPSAPAWRSVARPRRFNAAHWLEGLPEGHKCGRPHGHGYTWGVRIDPASGAPMTVLQPAEAFVRRHLHQQALNEVLPSNPTAEHLAAHLGAQFTTELQIPGIAGVLVAETPTTLAEWRPAEQRR